MTNRVVPKKTTIPSGSAVSSQTTGTHGTPGGGIDAGGLTLVGLEMPSAWTAADITFLESSDGVNFKSVNSAAGTEYKLTTPTADKYIPLADLDTRGMRFIKVRSGTAALPVNQAADRIITLCFRDLGVG